ncbi:MAG: PA14 domain-containing protein [Thermoanaerobaculia bacterium]
MFGTKEESCFGLKGEIYFLATGADRLPDVAGLRPVGSIYATELNVPERQFQEGFPGVTDRFEWFAIDYKGRFLIDRPGQYRIRITSDDGSKVTIDNRLVVDNDGTHGVQTREGSVSLESGIHTIRVEYFQGPRYYVALVLEIAGEGEEYRVLNFEEMGAPCAKTGWLRLVAELPQAKKRSKNLEIILDASGSMRRRLGATTRWGTALEVLKQVLAKIPDDFNVGLRVYAHRHASLSAESCTDTELVVPIAKLDRDRILAAVKPLKPKGDTPLVYSVLQAPGDLKELGGGSVVLITDGEETCHGNPEAAAKELKGTGTDVTLDIVGFTLKGKRVERQLTAFAESAGGHYYSAQSGEALSRALMVAAMEKISYRVLDASGHQVAKGEAGRGRKELLPGRYRIVVQAPGKELVEEVRVVAGSGTVLTVAQEGDRFVIER